MDYYYYYLTDLTGVPEPLRRLLPELEQIFWLPVQVVMAKNNTEFFAVGVGADSRIGAGHDGYNSKLYGSYLIYYTSSTLMPPEWPWMAWSSVDGACFLTSGSMEPDEAISALVFHLLSLGKYLPALPEAKHDDG